MKQTAHSIRISLRPVVAVHLCKVLSNELNHGSTCIIIHPHPSKVQDVNMNGLFIDTCNMDGRNYICIQTKKYIQMILISILISAIH